VLHSEDKILTHNLCECIRFFARILTTNFSVRIGKEEHWTTLQKLQTAGSFEHTKQSAMVVMNCR